jgi:hypothetical protein
MALSTTAFPPKVQLTFRVGVVGHRPDRLDEADLVQLGTVIQEILKTIQVSVKVFACDHPGLYADDAPKLIAVSPCAEGSDRIFAAQAIALGYALHCPMPFAQEVYEQDFVGSKAMEKDSLTTFRQLLEQAKRGAGLSTFELDGSRADTHKAYGHAGNVVLNQSELLVVVWDGVYGKEAGGTAETLKEAISYGVPIIWIDAQKPHDWQVLREKSELTCLQSKKRCIPVGGTMDILPGLVSKILDVPSVLSEHENGDHPKKPDLREAYMAERMPRWNVAVLWKLFRNAVGANQLSFQSVRLESVDTIASREWPISVPGVAGWVNERIGHHYIWADRLADYYADLYRSSFLFAFLGGAVAVFLAILPVWGGWGVSHFQEGLLLAAGIELGVLLGIIGVIVWGVRRRWHARWMEYRVLAELIRELHFLIPLGGGRPFARLFAHLGVYGRPMETWMSWHARAIERAIGLPSVKVDKNYIGEALSHLKAIVDGQIAFHHTSHHRHHHIEERLHLWGVSLFGITAVVVAIHFGELMVGMWGGHEGTHEGLGWMTVAAAFLPVIGAALAGINNQGEFARLAMRNKAMAKRLEGYAQEIGAMMNREAPANLSEVAHVSMRVAQLMIDEVVDWRVIFLHRPLVPPA